MRAKILSKLILGIVLVSLVSSLVLGEIILTPQPEAVYNLGDRISINVNVTSENEGSLKLYLVCEDAEVNLLNYPGKQISIDFDIQERAFEEEDYLTGNFSDLKGLCEIKGSYAGENETTQEFEITDKIFLTINANKIKAEVGEDILIKGEAIKKNSEKAEGYLEISSESKKIKIPKVVVENGTFETIFSFPENIESGEYYFNATVYEKEEEVLGRITNKGKGNFSIFVKQTPTSIGILADKVNITPGANFSFSPVIYDQAENKIEGKIALTIYDINNNKIYEKISGSEEEETFYVPKNTTPGYWNIRAEALGLSKEKIIQIEELEQVDFEIINETLIMLNTGNVVYRKPIQIFIGNHTEIKSVDLGVGEEISLQLSAPQGEYNVSVSDGENELTRENVVLTGKSIGVGSGGGFSLFSRYPIMWLFLIAVFGVFIMVMVQRIKKKKQYSFPVKEKNIKTKNKEKPIKEQARQDEEKQDNKDSNKGVEVVGKKRIPEKAEHSVVSQGRKEDVGILSIKISDLGKLEKNPTIRKLEEMIIDNKGAVYKTPEYVFGLFSSVTTKTFKNDMNAIKTGREIQRLLDEHNQKFSDKIGYGIGVNSGAVILKKEPDVLKFTGLGNSLGISKKIARLANNELLLSGNIHKKVISEVKTEKQEREGTEIHQIKRIAERDKYKGFIQGFLNRQRQEKQNKK